MSILVHPLLDRKYTILLHEAVKHQRRHYANVCDTGTAQEIGAGHAKYGTNQNS